MISHDRFLESVGAARDRDKEFKWSEYVRLGAAVSVAGGNVTVLLDGETSSIKVSYDPAIAGVITGDRVLCIKVGTGWICLCVVHL